MLRLLIYLFCGFTLAAGLLAERPNFVFILTDDHNFRDLGCNGNELIETPNIDRLAVRGARFTSGHITSAICTPSRVSILLSQFERKHGVNFNSGTSVAPEAWNNAYPVILRNNGYYTGYIGKNHSPVGEGGYNSGLMEESFDYWYAGHGHLTFYPKGPHEIFRASIHDTQVEILDEGMTDFLGRKHTLAGAEHFLASRPKDQPFCLSLCLNVPHGSSTRSMKLKESDPELYRTAYRGIDIPMPEHYIARQDIKTPKLPPQIHFADERQTSYDSVNTPEDNRERIIRTLQTVTGVDRLVGNLLDALKKQGLDENTIIIFSSDHGLFFGEHGLGGKALCYEVCTRVPFIIYDPNAPEYAKGMVSDELVQSIDIAPTMLDYAGIAIPDTFQGKSIRDLVGGKDAPVRDYLFTENLWSTHFGNPRCESVQDKEWKYIRYYKNNNLRASAKISIARQLGINQNDILYGVHDPDIALYRTFVEGPLSGEPAVYEELYNVKRDPGETTNLALDNQYSAVLDRLRAAWVEAIKAARGTGEPLVLRYTKDSQMEAAKP
jgi:arylsulfatase A-like enzyme